MTKRVRNRSLVLFAVLNLAAGFCAAEIAAAIDNPWGENLRERIHTDYLHTFAGKNYNYALTNLNYQRYFLFIYRQIVQNELTEFCK